MIPAWMKKPGTMKAGRIAGYVLFGTVVFAASLVLTFPTGRLRSYIENRASQAGYDVRIDELSIRGVSSMALFGVDVEFSPELRSERDGSVTQIPRTVHVDRLDISLGLFSLLFGDLSLTLTAESGDGSLGPVKVVRSGERLKVDVDEIEDFPVPTSFPAFGVKFAGTVSGSGTLDYDLKGGITTSSARVDLEGNDLVALKPTLRSDQHGDVTLSDVYLGKLKLAIALDRRSRIAALSGGRRKSNRKNDPTVLHLDTAEIDGKDVKVVSEGHSVVRMFPGRGLVDGQMNVELAFSLSDTFFDREVKGKGETSKPNHFLQTLLSMDPRWKRAQSAGYWGVVCTGSLRRPNCIPKKPVIRGGDFKVPEKAREKPEEPVKPKAKPAPPAPRATQPARTTTESRPAVKPRPRFKARPPSAEEEEAAAAEAARAVMKPAPSIETPTRTVVPTIIGRSRLKQVRNLRAIESESDEEDDGTSGGTVKGAAGDEEGEGEEEEEVE